MGTFLTADACVGRQTCCNPMASIAAARTLLLSMEHVLASQGSCGLSKPKHVNLAVQHLLPQHLQVGHGPSWVLADGDMVVCMNKGDVEVALLNFSDLLCIVVCRSCVSCRTGCRLSQQLAVLPHLPGRILFTWGCRGNMQTLSAHVGGSSAW